MRNSAIFALLPLLGCESKQVQTAPRPAPESEARQEVPEKVVAVTGWRNLRWGDTSRIVTGKCKGGPVVCGLMTRDGKKKGHMAGSQNCLLGNENGGKAAFVNLVYLDDVLQRIVIVYQGLTPDSSEVENLNSLLVERYC